MAVDRNAMMPIYQQISDALQELIAGGKYPPGSQLPSEHELMSRYGVSKVTARKAMSVLIEKGVAASRHGKGVYVASSVQLNTGVGNFKGFYASLRDSGVDAQVRLLDQHRLVPSKEILERLEVKERRKSHYFRRLFSASGEPFALFDTNFHPDIKLPSDVLEGLLENAILSDIYSDLDLTLGRIKYELQVLTPPSDVGEILQLDDPVTGLLAAHRMHYDDGNKPISTTTMYLRTDLYKFEFEMGSN